jgi:hypothetical protein
VDAVQTARGHSLANGSGAEAEALFRPRLGGVAENATRSHEIGHSGGD